LGIGGETYHGSKECEGSNKKRADLKIQWSWFEVGWRKRDNMNKLDHECERCCAHPFFERRAIEIPKKKLR
jgi:hypothetical protein